ncbi:S-adenosyl-L-methionine-dependent methyltransferase [Basidiobolus meristosporus CBS 931.73]|uniref:S-adenosyl-L-methionine-dependent methyltransferase n=1 Tax=Basidiobolus meristosporus CBS 931.73 TaxID=1314790 RepID=A0A1Y1ZCE0_9FUNG|nr:S-adenosyl-L-methionine-dependent methyltransferase [Basidiobolus meristosporus CBS 931.73]|eukprot:ORY07465.1 S-adenosyl-L-methionine-dependent methyltransferase [Basidiobolus meristosporus CBS 931.73]
MAADKTPAVVPKKPFEKRHSKVAVLLVVIISSILLSKTTSLAANLNEPLYGNVFSTYNLTTVSTTFFCIGCLTSVVFSHKTNIWSSFDLLSLIYAVGPLAVLYEQRFLLEYSPILTPHLIQASFAYPIYFLLGFENTRLATDWANQAGGGTQWWKLQVYAGLLSGLTVWFGKDRAIFHNTVYNVFYLAALASFLSILFKARTFLKYPRDSRPNYSALLIHGVVLLAILYSTSSIPQFQRGLVEGLHNPPDRNQTILARTESTTGWLSVFEEEERNIRLMRSGHSLIGGVFRETNESVFGSFYFMEAVHLAKKKSTEPKRALQIGLGVGVSAWSLIKNGVSVDVVEIDPYVYEYAKQFFDLPEPAQVHIQDGREYINYGEPAVYDYILHDVFTGGSVPATLFSLEALLEMKKVLKPDGILALNFLGSNLHPYNHTMAHVTHTLKAVFPHIRCYAEGTKNEKGVQNFVYFASSESISFRAPLEDEIHDSYIREDMLHRMPQMEVDLTYDPKLVSILTDENNLLVENQIDSALEHWKAMRTLLPSGFWWNY